MSPRSLRRRKIQSGGNAKNQDVLDLDFEGSMYEKGEDDDNFFFEYVDFIDSILFMLKYDPSERMTPSEALNHMFFNSKAEYEEKFSLLDTATGQVEKLACRQNSWHEYGSV
ncbi:hypothetical protein WA026_004227 [Henosepilachna vigintioctopunctata]|uniref:Uncharacterized protein n=1 Tax=Henosepilachna vigintioctopunctata TaxID=420089 RepID=A0AAW1V616_9CUCU